MVTSGVVQSTLYPSLATFKIGSETVKSGENYRYTTEDNWDAADNLITAPFGARFPLSTAICGTVVRGLSIGNITS